MSNEKAEQEAQEHSEHAEQQDSEQQQVETKNDAAPEEDLTAEPALDADPADIIARLEEELEEQQDLQLRARAETENIRRRAETEVANSRKFAIEAFAREMLAVRDSLELASAIEITAEQGEVVAKVEEGIQLTLKQMDHVFEKFDIREVTPVPGDKPDPDLHQAMSLVESEEIESGRIVSVMQKGYQLHERLLRPAMVLVAK